MFRTINISLPEDLIEEIDGLVEENTRDYRSRSHFLQVAIVEYIDENFENEEEKNDQG